MNDNEIIDIESAKERFMGNYKLFSKFLYQFPDKPFFTNVYDALNGDDVKGAFEAAHTLKGVAGNLSLKFLTERLHPVVEALRIGNRPTDDEWSAFDAAYKTTADCIIDLRAKDAELF